jgi:hypothetical protein
MTFDELVFPKAADVKILSSEKKKSEDYEKELLSYSIDVIECINNFLWYDDTKHLNIHHTIGFDKGVTSYPKVCEVICKKLRENGWKCRYESLFNGYYWTILIHNPTKKIHWLFRWRWK